MKKLFFSLLFLFAPLGAESTKTTFNPYTGKFDFITKVDTNTILAGTNITETYNNGSLTINASGSSGGYAVEPATVTFQLNKGVTASTITSTGLVQFSSNTILGSGTTFYQDGSIFVGGLSASLPVQTDANKKLTSTAIDLSGSQATGVLAVGREPAHTGDVTNSAGSLAMTAAGSQSNIKTFTSSITVTGAGGIVVTYGVTAATVTISSNTIIPGATFYGSGNDVRLSTVTLTGPMAMGTNKITGLLNGTASTDAAAFGQVHTITAWASYTPTFTGLGTVSGVSVLYRQVGDTIEVKGRATAGTVAGTAFSISLPVNIDSTKVASNAILGLAVGGSSGLKFWSDNTAGVLFYDGADATTVYAGYTATTSIVKMNGSTLLGTSSELCSFQFSYPGSGLTP